MTAASTPTLVHHLPRLVFEWARAEPATRWRELEGTMAYVDISGFTPMSERLSRRGKAGAEELTEVMNTAFARLLELAYAEGGALLKFGGDALLLFYDGDSHGARAARAAFTMRRALRELGRLQTSAGAMTLRMHAGIHSGRFHFLLVGDSHRELIVTGPAATATVAMEEASATGEIVLSTEAAALVEARALGAAKDEGRLLRGVPAGRGAPVPLPPTEGVELERYVPAALRPALAAAAVEPEHRHAAVALIRFAGADTLLAAEGPEALTDAVEELVVAVQGAADEHGVCCLESFVDRDGGRFVLVAGAPETAGNDEERLLRTVRAIMDSRPRLQLQIGASQGRVFAGEVGAAFRRTYTILGDTAALAARLMTRARVGEILAAADVVTRSRTLFATAELAPFKLKGIAEPVRAVAVGSIEGVREVGERRRLPMIDRERELAVLGAAVAPARMGFGSLVELVGDAGIGKSRLLEEIRQQTSEMIQLTSACEQYEAATAYFAFRHLLRALLGLELDGTAAENTERLRARLEPIAPELLPWLPLLAVPLDAAVLPTAEADELQPAFRRARLHGAVTSLLGALLRNPTLLLFEDVHWMDEASAALLRHLGAQITARPWLACLTRRPVDGGFSAAAGTPPVPALTLRLDPLPAGDARSLAAAAAGRELPAAELDAIAERAGGNPLFVQELVGATAGDAELEELPESVEAVVAARIDGLAPADRALLRRASVLGAGFEGDLVAEVLADDPSAAADSDAWERLAEFIERDPETAGAFRFRHALIRDAAYEGLSIRRRRELHVTVAEAYERRFHENPADIADRLSLHYGEGGSWEQAWRYSILAADRAAGKHANVEAAALYRRALGAAARLRGLPPEQVGGVWEALGDVSELAGRYREAADAYRSARRHVGSQPRLLLKEGLIREREGRYDQALRWYSRGLAAAARLPDESARRRHRVEFALAYAGVKHRQGRFRECVAWCEDAVRDAIELDDLRPLAHAYYLLHIAHTRLGSRERDAFRGLALPIYEEVGDLLGQANVLNNLGIEAYYEGRWDDALELYRRSRALRERAGDVVGAATMTSNIGEILSDQGQLEQAAELFEQVEQLTDAAGNRLMSFVSRGNRGRAAARAGRFDEAEELLLVALEGFRGMRAASFVAETEARLAELHLFRGRPVEALAAAQRALGSDGAEPARRAMLLRLRGYALLQAGERDAARESLEESRRCALAAGSKYELALTLGALAEAGADDGGALAAESARLLGELGVQSLPRGPLPPSE